MAADYPGRVQHGQAIALWKAGRLADALAMLGQAEALSPGHAGIHYDRAGVLTAAGQIDGALAAYDAALARDPKMQEAHYNRAVLLLRQQRLPEALSALDAAVAIRPDMAAAWNNRAGVLLELGQFDEALKSMDKALLLRPGDAAGHYNRGALLLNLNRFEEALAAFDLTLRLNPAHPGALGLFTSSALRACNWEKVAALTPRLLPEVAAGKSVVPPLTLIAFCDDPVLQRKCAETNLAVTLAQTVVPENPAPKWQGQAYGHDRIRIAYISTDLRAHPVGLQIVDMLERHDRARFEVIGIFLGRDDGTQTHQRIRAACDRFLDVWDKGDEDVARLIRELEVDILVDLNGQTMGWRPGILKYRPAPVQAFYLGYAGTTGAPFIDYIIADAVVAPFDHQPNYSETIVHLPHSFWPSDPGRELVAPITRAEAGLPEDGFVFCCFNVHWKLSAPMFAAWMRLLAAVPGSVLWLREATPGITRNLQRAAQNHGVDPARLIWAPRMAQFDQHLARHVLADLFLDSFPYNAHVTASDALWAGLPLVTLQGKSFVSRVASSLLTALDLPELVTTSLPEYEALALALAKDPARLKALRERLAENLRTQPLFDAPGQVRRIEAAYTHMRTRAESGDAPAPFTAIL